jgi:serine/threonine protein kinase
LLLGTIASHTAVVLENRRVRESAGPASSAIEWSDEPAALCVPCRMVAPPHTAVCATCGQRMVRAALPLVVHRKFRVERLIGSGGMSVVYLATDTSLGRKVAIKTLPRVNTDRAARLQREARTMAAIRHANLAMIFGVESWHGIPLIIEEYLEGGTLADRLRTGPLAPRDALELGIVLADVLDGVHQAGVLHRDIKPTNIGYTIDGVPKLMDFGVARILHGSQLGAVDDPALDALPRRVTSELALASPALSLTSSDLVIGTPPYLSPEALSAVEPDSSIDIWSLSVVLFEVIAGEHPFRAADIAGVLHNIRDLPAPDVRSFRPDCPPAIAEFFTRALAHDRTQRQQTAAELRSELRRLRAHA